MNPKLGTFLSEHKLLILEKWLAGIEVASPAPSPVAGAVSLRFVDDLFERLVHYLKWECEYLLDRIPIYDGKGVTYVCIANQLACTQLHRAFISACEEILQCDYAKTHFEKEELKQARKIISHSITMLVYWEISDCAKQSRPGSCPFKAVVCK